MAPRTIPIRTLSDKATAPYRDRGALLMALGLTASAAQQALDQLEAGRPAAAKLTLRMALNAAKKQLARIEEAA